MPKIDVVTLLPWDQSKSGRAIAATNDSALFPEVFNEFLTRGDCILVLELDDSSEIGLSPEVAGWNVATHHFGQPSISAQLRKQPEVDPPPMPDWASLDGPWCLKYWCPFGVPNPNYTTCLLSLNHDGRCRDQHGLWHDSTTSLLLGQGENKEPANNEQ